MPRLHLATSLIDYSQLIRHPKELWHRATRKQYQLRGTQSRFQSHKLRLFVFDKNASLVYVSFIQAWENVVHNIAHAEFFNKCIIIIERINVFNSSFWCLCTYHSRFCYYLIKEEDLDSRSIVKRCDIWLPWTSLVIFSTFPDHFAPTAKLSHDEGEKIH